MISIGICSSTTLDIEENRYNYELTTLLNEARKNFDEVIVINPLSVCYTIDPAKNQIKIIHKGQDISNLSALIVRSTRTIEKAISLLTNSLNINGCKIIDPIDRFSGAKASKLLTTLTRFEKKVGAPSYYAFNESDATTLLHELKVSPSNSIIFKPIGGSKGKGIIKANSLDNSLQFVKEFFKQNKSQTTPLFFQKYINYTNEYRVMIVGGKSIGIVEKLKQKDSAVANASKGAVFKKTKNELVENFSISNVSNQGILGVDVAKNEEGTLNIIEANRAPQWFHFEKATNVNVAKKIIDYVIERVYQKN